MIVNIEFFDEEPLANVVGNLNYEMDKTIFFGYQDVMEPHQKHIEKFLKQVCKAPLVEFYAVPRNDLLAIIKVITDVVQREKTAGNRLYFDLTGGESLLLAAFGIMAKTFECPMYRVRIRTNEVHEFCSKEDSLEQNAKKRHLAMNLDQFIMLYDGAINYRHKKNFKEMSREREEDIEQIWKLSRRYEDQWVHYSSLLRKFPPDTDLTVQTDAKMMTSEFRRHCRDGRIQTFHRFLEECSQLGVLQVDSLGDRGYWFRYKNQDIKEIFWDSGSILEMYTFLLENRRQGVDDCRVGVHIDWDGVLDSEGNRDVLNEIDVMSIRNNLPTFISCKIGNVDQMSLYELETVANRFGGKYAKKVLATAKKMSPAHMRRAEEMDIEVRIVR